MKYMDCGNMRTELEALYLLDNALTDPSEEYLRIITKEESETDLRYLIDNGSICFFHGGCCFNKGICMSTTHHLKVMSL